MLSETERNQIIRLTLEGWSRGEVAKMCACTTDTVRNVLKRYQPEAFQHETMKVRAQRKAARGLMSPEAT
jgi:transposase